MRYGEGEGEVMYEIWGGSRGKSCIRYGEERGRSCMRYGEGEGEVMYEIWGGRGGGHV